MTPDGSGYKLVLSKDYAEYFGLTDDRRKVKVVALPGRLVIELQENEE